MLYKSYTLHQQVVGMNCESGSGNIANFSNGGNFELQESISLTYHSQINYLITTTKYFHGHRNRVTEHGGTNG